MAIVNSMWLKGSKKRLGGTVIYQAMGQTRQRELAAEVANPRTTSQMSQRVKWANLVNLYRANRAWMKYAFETKRTNQSEYNKFMSLNVASSNIYLPKQIAAAGGCVVTGYLITQGSLPSIECLPATNSWITNIVLQPSFVIQQGLHVSVFSAMLLQYNPAIRQGDQLSFVRLTQQTNAINGAPYVVVREYELIVDVNDESELQDYLPLDYIGSNESSTDCRLIVKDSGAAGGFTLILSRTISGKTYVSSQRIVVANNSTIINAYSSTAALQAAIDSYGEEEDAFLSTTSANKDNQAPTLLSILSLQTEEVDEVGVAGSRFVVTDIQAGDSLLFKFNGDVPAGALAASVATNKGTFVLSSVTKEGNEVSGEVPDGQADLLNVAIWFATVTIGTITYRIDFIIRNEDTQGGLE